MSYRRSSSTSSNESVSPSKFTVVFMGDAKVGKSSIISQFFRDTFDTQYKETVEEMYGERVEADGEEIKLDILDTAGAYSFPAMKEIYMKKADAFVLVYAIDDDASFEKVAALREEIVERRGENASIVVVGNKRDLREEVTLSDIQRDAYVTCDWGHKHVDCSAKNKANLGAVISKTIQCLQQTNSVPEFILVLRRGERASRSRHSRKVSRHRSKKEMKLKDQTFESKTTQSIIVSVTSGQSKCQKLTRLESLKRSVTNKFTFKSKVTSHRK